MFHMKHLAIALWWVFMVTTAPVEAQQTWQFGGNPYTPYSDRNPYSNTANPYNPDGLRNPYSQYGSPYSTTGARNPYGDGLRVEPESAYEDYGLEPDIFD